jgi:cell wall-associated NlpC family hydrolase
MAAQTVEVFHMLSQATTIHRVIILVIACGLIGAGCASGSSTKTTMPRASSAETSRLGSAAARIAIEQVGAPYRYGGTNSSGFDCSGLVHYAYLQVGKQVPRTTGDLWRGSQPVSASNLQTGDILFFDIGGKMSHVGIYLGDGRFVHAPSTGKRVTVATLDSVFYQQAFIRGGRL